MIVHNLKIKYQYAKDIVSGDKTFELRKNDRNYQVGDYIAFDIIDCPSIPLQDSRGSEVWHVKTAINNIIYKITYKLEDVPEYGLLSGYCILGMSPVHFEKDKVQLM